MLGKGDHFPKIDKNPMREITNSSKNKLATRLYRNSSLSRINPNISMLSSSIQQIDPSFLNCSVNASNSQLIASISLKKLKKKSQFEPYLQINNGKMLINKHKGEEADSHLKGSSPKPKKMFKKLDKLSHSPSNKILPDELIDFTIERQQPNQNKLIKKSGLIPNAKPKTINNRFSSQYEDRDDLLPEDFIQLLSEDKNITNQFCYLKKMEHPYDLKIVQFDKNFEKKQSNSIVQYPSEYITISSRGVTYFSSQQSRFVPLKQWKREANYFKKIIKLDFFKNFKVIKNFSNWKKYIRKSAMKSTIEKLKQKMVFNDKFLRSSLLQIRGICYVLETDVSYCRLDDCNKVANFRQFKTAQQIFIQNEFERRIFSFQENVKQVLMNNMAESMKQFKEENKISSSIEGKGMPLLIGDEKNLQMPYTKQATLRTQQQKFQKFIKLVDLLITHSKVNMMAESTNVLSKKIDEQNQNYEKQVVESNYKNTYKGKQYLQCILTLDCNDNSLFIRPTKQDLTSLFQDIVNRSVVRLCRNHKKISSDIDVLSIIYDSQQQFPKQSESENLKAIMTSDNRQQQMLKLIMNSVSKSYEHILSYVKRFKDLARVNFQNIQKMDDIEKLQSKDYQTIKNLIEKWQKQKEIISLINKQHQGPLFELNLKQFKQKTEKTTNQCISKIKEKIPKIFGQAINGLQQNLLLALSQIEQQPIGVQALMVFNQHKYRIMSDIQEYSDKMMEIMCLENLMRNILPPNSQSNGFKKFEKQIKDLQSSLQRLRQKLSEADVNNKRREDKAQNSVKQMVPQNKRKLKQLYDQIKEKCEQQKPEKEMVSIIQNKKNTLNSILTQFQNIRVYQRFLNLEESSSSQMDSFAEYFGIFQKLWTTANQFNNQKQEISESTWGSIKTVETNSKLEQIITIMVGLQKVIKEYKQKDSPFQFSDHDHLAIEKVLEQIEKIKPLIQTIQCLNDKTLGDKQWKQIKLTIQQRNPRLAKILQLDRYQTKIKELINADATSELDFFKSVALKAKRNNQIYTKFDSVKTFTNFSKSNPNIFKNLTEKFKQTIGDFMAQLDQKIIMTNFILQETQQSDKEKQERTKTQKNTLQKLKQILILWNQYEEHVQYFEPIYTSMPDWKMTHQGKSFIAATDQNWKKTYRSFNKQTNLTKILSTQRIIPSLKESNQILQSLYSNVRTYFNSKRLQSTRLYFLSDEQIIKIHSQNKENKDIKDFKEGFNKYISKIFPNVRQLRIKQESIPCEVINLDGEQLSIKFGRSLNTSPEVQQMIKTMDEAIKNGIKTCLKSCSSSFDSQQFCKLNWIRENPLQILIFITQVYFTKIIEQDYLHGQGDDIEKLYTYHLNQIEELRSILKEEQENELMHKKLLVLLTQALSIRDTISYLIESNITTKQSYDWQKQVRHYYNSEQAYVQYLNTAILYGNEFVCMASNPLLTTMLNEKSIINLVNNMLCCSNIPIVSQSFLPEICAYNAKPYNNVSFVSGNQINILESAIVGTWLTGSFTDISLSSQFSEEQLVAIAKTIQQIQLAVPLKQPYFRGFKNMSVNRESGIALICPALMSSPCLKQCKFDYRVINHVEVSWLPYIDLLFEIYNISIPNLAKKLSKIFCYLQSAVAQLQICRRDFRAWITQIAAQEVNQNLIARMILKKINKKDFKPSTRKFISKMFHQVFNIACLQQLTSYKSIKDFSVTEQEIGKIVSILKQSKVCIVTGQNNEFNQLIILSSRKNFSPQNTKPKFIIVRWNSIANLLGKFVNGKWINGVLTQKINCANSDRQCFILIGNCCKNLLGLLEKFNSKSNQSRYVNLQNGQKLFLKSDQKIIFMTQTNINDPIFNSCTIKIHDLSKAKFAAEQLLYYLTKQKINNFNGHTLQSRHFNNNPQLLTMLMNLYLNNCQKISGANLKTIGFKSQYGEPDLIMNRFITLMNASLTKDPQKICLQNSKMFEKLYLWSLFWSIYCTLPKRCMERLEKLFDSIKIQYDKTQSLSQSKFSISQRNQTVFKFLKTGKVYQNEIGDQFLISPQLQAKKELIKLLVSENNHTMILGERGCGKTGLTNYLESSLKSQGYSFVKTKIAHCTTVEKFLEWLKPKTYLQYFPNNINLKYKLCSINGKKLIVIVDNFNLIRVDSALFEFFHTAISFGYYFDTQSHSKVSLGDICFVCAKNGAFESVSHMNSFLLRKFFPIYVNQTQMTQIMNVYSQNIQSIQIDENKQVIKKILPSIASLHSFACNLFNSESTKQDRSISNNIPIWIAKQLVTRAQDQKITVTEIVSYWRYFTIKKYVESGVLYQISDQIRHQLTNLISLICKSSNQPSNFMSCQKNLVSEMIRKNPLIGLSSDQSQYFIYFACLLKSQQTKHLITHSRCTAPLVKAQAVKQICDKSKINFFHIKNEKQLQIAIKQNNVVVFIDGTNKKLVQLGLEALIQQNLNPQLSFVIDLESKNQLLYYIRFYPNLEDYSQIYDVSINSYSTSNIIPTYNAFNDIISISNIQIKQKEHDLLFCQIDETMKNLQPKINDIIHKQVKNLQIVYQNFKALSDTIQNYSFQSQKITKQISQLVEQQEEALARKNKLVEQLSKLKKQNEQLNHQDKEATNKNIGALDSQIKKIKSSKNDKIEKVAKLKQNFKQKQQIYSLLTYYRQLYKRDYSICDQLIKSPHKSDIFNVINSIVYLFYQKPEDSRLQKLLISIKAYSVEKLAHQLNNIYSAVLGIQIQNFVQDECVIRWIISGYQSIFCTSQSERLIQKLIGKCPEAKFCATALQYSQHVGTKPVVVKQLNNWNQPRVSIICDDNTIAKNHIKYSISQQERKQDFCFKVYQKITQKHSQKNTTEIKFLKTQRKRFQIEESLLRLKLKDKIRSQKNQFLSSNSISQIKQILDSITAMHGRAAGSLQKIQTNQNQMKLKYSQIVSRSCICKEFLSQIQKMFSYTNLKEEQLIQLILKSLVYKQEEKNEGNQEGAVAKKELLVDESNKKILQKCYQWVCLQLTPIDSVYSIFLSACYSLYLKKVIRSNELKNIIELLQANVKNINYEIAPFGYKKLDEVIQNIKNSKQNKLFSMIQFAQSTLDINFMNLTKSRQVWVNSISSLFQKDILANNQGENKNCKMFMAIGSLEFNPYKLVDKQLRRVLAAEQNIVYLSQSDSIDHKIQALEKVPASQQGWIILLGWRKEQNLYKMFEFMKQPKSYKILFLYENQKDVIKLKPQLRTCQYYQIGLFDRTKTHSYQIQRIFAKHYLENSSNENNKILRMMASDQVSKLCKGFNNPVYKSTSYSYRIIEYFIKKNPKITPSDIVSLALDYYYNRDSTPDRLFLRQAKKIVKIANLPQIFDDGWLPEAYNKCLDTYQQLKVKIEKEDKLKSFLHEILPEEERAIITTDFLMSLGSQKYEDKISNVNQKATQMLNKSQARIKLQNILQKIPILGKNQQSDKSTFLYLDMLKTQRKQLALLYNSTLDQLKGYHKILESKRSISLHTQKVLQLILSQSSDKILHQFLELERKSLCIQKQIESKQTFNICACLELVSSPSHFLYAYIFENLNHSKVDWANFELHIRCLTEKQKEMNKQPIEKNQYLLLSNVKLLNGKFEPHKCYLESTNKGDCSKLSNVFIYLGKQENQQYARKIPFIINKANVAEIQINSKAKQLGFWGYPVYATI